mgnify:CR=1 FL=1
MISSKLKRLTQAGDTIVEVLVVVAIVSLVLGGAYASARRSFISTVQTQERGEAVKHLEAQLEGVKAVSDLPNSPIYQSGLGTFCAAAGSITNGSCTRGIDNRYTISIQRSDSNVGGRTVYTFQARAVWDRAGGGQQEVVTMSYRVHPKL